MSPLSPLPPRPLPLPRLSLLALASGPALPAAFPSSARPVGPSRALSSCPCSRGPRRPRERGRGGGGARRAAGQPGGGGGGERGAGGPRAGGPGLGHGGGARASRARAPRDPGAHGRGGDRGGAALPFFPVPRRPVPGSHKSARRGRTGHRSRPPSAPGSASLSRPSAALICALGRDEGPAYLPSPLFFPFFPRALLLAHLLSVPSFSLSAAAAGSHTPPFPLARILPNNRPADLANTEHPQRPPSSRRPPTTLVRETETALAAGERKKTHAKKHPAPLAAPLAARRSRPGGGRAGGGWGGGGACAFPPPFPPAPLPHGSPSPHTYSAATSKARLEAPGGSG